MQKIILLENIRSLQNVGAIFRNADGAGFSKMLLTGHTPTPPRNDIAKTALGAQNWIDWEYFENTVATLQHLRKEGFLLYAVELTPEAVEYRTLCTEKYEKICLIVGNEVSGISKEVLQICDKHVIIPMKGKKNSLNVSVAAGIVMYALAS